MKLIASFSVFLSQTAPSLVLVAVAFSYVARAASEPPAAMANPPSAVEAAPSNTALPSAPVPIIINNIQPAAQPPGSSSLQGITQNNDYPMHFGLSAAYYVGADLRRFARHPEDLSTGSAIYRDKQWAGLVSLGADFLPWFSVTGYALTVLTNSDDGNNFDAGGDVDFAPFRVTTGNFDLIQMGVLVGSSINFIRFAKAPVYGGARLTISLDRKFGITGAMRTNLALTMMEVGVVTHF